MASENKRQPVAAIERLVDAGRLCSLALSGCTVGPNYVRPAVETPAAYKETGWKPATPRDGTPRGKWWEVFNDPQLDALLSQVEINNQTVKAAEARCARRGR